jgi:hypothetical protein
MENKMDASQARDHLEWIDGILRTADRSLHFAPFSLIAWGFFGTTVNALHQASALGLAVPPDQAVHVPLMLVAIAVSVWDAGRTAAGRRTFIDSHASAVFVVVFGVLMLVNLTAQHTILSGRGMALFWSAGFSIALLIVGVQASLPLLLGGAALLVAITLATLVPGWFDGILALGWAAGFIGPGLVLMFRRSDG